MKADKFSILTGFIGGLLITLVTGLIPTKILLGATHYGFPFTWIIRLVLSSDYYPWRLNILGLFGNMVVWIVITTLILGFIRSRK